MAKEPAYMTNLREYSKGNLGNEHLEPLEAELFGASDRAAALIYCSLVENALIRLVSTKLRDDLNSSERREIFETFERTIIIAYALNLIGPICRSDLDLIRFLRNQFAHSRRPLDFNIAQVGAVCAALQYPDRPDAKALIRLGREIADVLKDEAVAKTPEYRKVPRNRYTMACHTLASRMLGVVSLPSDAVLKLYGQQPLP